MNDSKFLWHAKRGHGESIIELNNGILNENFEAVKHIILNNYAFLKRNEYRSSFAYTLASFYERDEYYIGLLFKKLKKTKLEDDYTFVYLVDTLYFFLKNASNDYKKKVINFFKTQLNKKNYSIDESASISSMVSLILDLYKEKKDILEIVNYYYASEPESTLDLSIIERDYDIVFKKNKKNLNPINFEYIDDVDFLISKIQNNEVTTNILTMISNYVSKETLEKLISILPNVSLDIEAKVNILKIIYYSNLCNVKLFEKLLVNFNKNEAIFDKYLLEIACTLKSKKIKQFGFSLLKAKYSSFGIRIILNNYDLYDYNLVKNHIEHLKIDYEDSDYWYEVEDALISNFKKKNVDLRLLNEVKYFMNNGLSSTSRYELVKILLKYKSLSDAEICCLKLDANVDIRELLRE